MVQSLQDWADISVKLTEEELLGILTTDEDKPEAWRVMAALGFLALNRGEIGLHQIEVLTAAGMDVIALTMFDAAFSEADADDMDDMLAIE